MKFDQISRVELTSKLRPDLPVRVASPEECEKAEMCVCVFTGQEAERFKADNIYTVCADCQSPITHRPDAPKAPPKVCMRCAIVRMRAAEEHV